MSQSGLPALGSHSGLQEFDFYSTRQSRTGGLIGSVVQSLYFPAAALKINQRSLPSPFKLIFSFSENICDQTLRG